jgi:hypothetical protein
MMEFGLVCKIILCRRLGYRSMAIEMEALVQTTTSNASTHASKTNPVKAPANVPRQCQHVYSYSCSGYYLQSGNTQTMIPNLMIPNDSSDSDDKFPCSSYAVID